MDDELSNKRTNCRWNLCWSMLEVSARWEDLSSTRGCCGRGTALRARRIPDGGKHNAEKKRNAPVGKGRWMMAKRIQRRRVKGWKMPKGCVYVGRPTVFGNPFSLSLNRDRCLRFYGLYLRRRWKDLRRLGQPEAAIIYLQILRIRLTDNLPKLRGKDLYCWCPLDQKCHADMLLKLAVKEEE